MTQFLDLLPETISEEILPVLSHNDLLRLRRVCAWTQFLVDDYISLKGRPISTQIELVENSTDAKEKKFGVGQFLELDPCPSSTSFFYNIYHYRIESLPTFQNRFGHQITHLQVKTITLPHLKKEAAAFFRALPNVTHLTVEKMNTNNLGFGSERLKGSDFPNLTHLTVNQDICETPLQFQLLWELFLAAPKLKHFKYPEYQPHMNSLFYDPGILIGTVRGGPNGDLIHLLQQRQRKVEAGEFSKLESIDLEHFGDRNFFHDFCGFALNYSITLWNVDPTFFLRMSRMMPFTVGSLKGGLSREMFSTDMPQLRKIEIGTNKYLKFYDFPVRFAQLPRRGQWENLEEIHVVVNGYLEKYGFIEWKGLFDFLFKDIKRDAVIDFALGYQFETPKPDPPIPLVKNIVESCPNIRKLTLVGWPGTNKALSMLWKGLPLLESVALENIPTLGNAAFVGKDQENPVFLTLDKLKCLRLLGLRDMPKVTDTVFKLVFCHLPLTEFELYGYGDLPGVTADGIRALLQGKFAETIEKFPFNNWKLEDVSEEEFQILEKQFRSSQMI